MKSTVAPAPVCGESCAPHTGRRSGGRRKATRAPELHLLRVQGASAARPAGLAPDTRPMSMAIRSSTAIRLSFSGPRMALLMKLGPPCPCEVTSRLLASVISLARLASSALTPDWAAAGTAGSLSTTEGQLTVGTPAAWPAEAEVDTGADVDTGVETVPGAEELLRVHGAK